MEQKTIFVKVGQPVRLCSECAIIAEDLLSERYTLQLRPVIHQKTQCTTCGKLTYTLEYTTERKLQTLRGTRSDQRVITQGGRHHLSVLK